MTTERLEMRLDAEERRRLGELAKREQTALSEVLRSLISKAYEAKRRARRREIAQELVALEVEDVPEPDELRRQLAAKYDFERLH